MGPLRTSSSIKLQKTLGSSRVFAGGLGAEPGEQSAGYPSMMLLLLVSLSIHGLGFALRAKHPVIQESSLNQGMTPTMEPSVSPP